MTDSDEVRRPGLRTWLIAVAALTGSSWGAPNAAAQQQCSAASLRAGIISQPPHTGPGTNVVNPDCTGTLYPSSGGSVAIVGVDSGQDSTRCERLRPKSSCMV